MVRLYPLLFFALLVLVMPVESEAQDGKLAKLSEVRIIVEALRSDGKELGLNENDIKNHVFVLLRSKLPRLVVKDSVIPYVFINVSVGKDRSIDGQIIGYYGSVSVQVMREVTINKTGSSAIADLWQYSRNITGPMGSTDSHIRAVLDKILTDFAADWYRDNP